MELLADTHVHVYSAHDPAALLTGALTRLRRAARSTDAPCALLLTEAHHCNWFQSLRDGSHNLPASFEILPCDEPEALRIHHGSDQLLVFAGRQIVTAERLEILALTLADLPEDGRPAADVIADVDARHAVPVLAWAPGKWMFSRSRVVQDLAQHAGDILRLGDSSLRCIGWPQPLLMRQHGPNLLAGSDPLPFPSEEHQAGTYGVRISLEFDPDRPVRSLRRALANPQTPIQRIGHRNTPWRMAARMLAHRRHKSAHLPPA